MIKIGQIYKLASFYRLAVFLTNGSDADVERALRQLLPILPEQDIVNIFDLWKDKDSPQALNNITEYTDDILSKYSEIESKDFNILNNAIDIIVSDIENYQSGNSLESSFQEDVDTAQKSVDYQPGQEMSQEVGGSVTEGNEAKRERAAAYAKRMRELLVGLKARPDYEYLKGEVYNGAISENLGITKEQQQAITYDINVKNNLSTSRVVKMREINRLIGMGLSRQQAEKKYKELLDFETISPEKFEQAKQTMETTLSDEEVKERLSKLTDEQINKYKKQKIIPMTGSQRKMLVINAQSFIKKLLIKNPAMSEDEAKETTKNKFSLLKNKIKYLSVEKKDQEIKEFLQELKQAV